MYFAGVDVGSTMTKIVILNVHGEIYSVGISHTGAEHSQLTGRLMEETLNQAGLSLNEINYVIATGYGRVNVPFANRQLTELTCHAKGVFSLFPSARTTIDIGGQDAKGIKINNGKLVDFVMNDKCAAGTGRFLEITADTFNLKLEDLGEISLKSSNTVKISNTCTIFAQQEMISHLSEGTPLEDILAGLHNAIASRVARMVQRLKIEPDVVLTGGVAKNIGVVRAMKENLGYRVLVPKNPLITGALGAAILAKEFVMEPRAKNELNLSNPNETT